ncbi:hypothetical protein PR202_gb19803 [Eleusine coracana subsp. coracana]|uniref:Peroxidase n=1 Tax=Eleusine coracana subsp. coracana TaxID=191504 RepID=A0AAV5F6W8_ELECO|nr:hypothetical protein QOZ80_3BG0280730 [Eleusine coracana subsp. coracana]GJN31408.1 hypothetical protein PR202_gb19803 [Eleusine coracana subsp. coracana]
MAPSSLPHCCFVAACVAAMAFIDLLSATPIGAQPLDPHFYDKSCPAALPTIKRIVEEAVAVEPRMGASLLRLHFHDCFVNGCDGSILLDDTPLFTGEKNAAPNVNSVRGFEVIDRIKAAVNDACRGNVVSCADIVAVAARDSVVALGGPSYDVPLGRCDARTASQAAANASIPAPTSSLAHLASTFASRGLSVADLVALSGAHSLGFARCTNFRDRAYNETTSGTLDGPLAASLRAACPRVGGDDNLAPLDPTPARFDGGYFAALTRRRGVLHSDQQLFFAGGVTDALVAFYGANLEAFGRDFADAMVRMASIGPLTGRRGEIRYNCRKVD